VVTLACSEMIEMELTGVRVELPTNQPIALLRELRAAGSPVLGHAPGARIRHLFHDREEFTVVGTVHR